MTATVQLIEASNGTVTKISKLCEVSGKIPVYADEGNAASVHARDIAGCSMMWKGENLPVQVQGAKAMTTSGGTYAAASVTVVPPDAVPLYSICGPQPLADSRAHIRVSGAPKTVMFSLVSNHVSLLNAKPTVWLEAEVRIDD